MRTWRVADTRISRLLRVRLTVEERELLEAAGEGGVIADEEYSFLKESLCERDERKSFCGKELREVRLVESIR